MFYEISCSLVAYKNEAQLVSAAINSFLNTDLNIHLYIIDNSPTDTLKCLVTNTRISYIHNPSNPGFGAAHNIAINLAIQKGSKYHVVLNPDVYFDGGTIERIYAFMEGNNEIGNVMPKVIYPDGSLQYLCKLLPTPYDWIGRRFNPFKNMVEKRNEIFELKFTHYNKIMEVPYLSGCFMFLRTSALQKIGLFDDGIFMYGEETDLCRRLIKSGYKTMFFPGAQITHEFAKGSHKSLKLTWIGMKSAIYYFNKWGWFFDKERVSINKRILKQIKSAE
jgi:GT2 family glycosyltransferase